MASMGGSSPEHQVLLPLLSAPCGAPGLVAPSSESADGRQNKSNKEGRRCRAAGQPDSLDRKGHPFKSGRHAPQHSDTCRYPAVSVHDEASAFVYSTGELRALTTATGRSESKNGTELNRLVDNGDSTQRDPSAYSLKALEARCLAFGEVGFLPPVRQHTDAASDMRLNGAEETAPKVMSHTGSYTEPKGSLQEHAPREPPVQSEQAVQARGEVQQRFLRPILVTADASRLQQGVDSNDLQCCNAEPQLGFNWEKWMGNTSFWRRTLSKQEADSDLQCYIAYEHLLAFYYNDSKVCDDSLNVTTPECSQRRQRERVARVVAETTPDETTEKPKRKPKGLLSAITRRAHMTCATVEELYEQLMVCYRAGGVEKGCLDTLFMKEVLSGRQPLRVHEMVGDNLRERWRHSKMSGGSNRSTGPPSLYEVMLEQMRTKTTPAFLHHNAISVPVLRFLEKRGTIKLGNRSYVLRLWDDEERGYLVTSLFDRKPKFPKNYRDSCTPAIYAREMGCDRGTRFGDLLLVRQHLAPGARKHFPEEGKLIRGHTVIREARVLDIFDGRVCGVPPDLRASAFQRTGIHASVQALAHYDSLFPQWCPLRSIIHPQDILGHPVVNPAGGMYCLSLIVNGATRMVKVDDRVPVEPESGLFRCLTSSTFELYPALLEKALLKANGCGVNLALMESAAVLFQLGGWIPEVIRFRSTGGVEEPTVDGLMRPSEMWPLLIEGYNFGRLMLTFTAHWCADRPLPTAAKRVKQGAQRFATPVVYPVIDMVTQTGRSSEGVSIRAVLLRDTTKDPSTRRFEPPFKTSLTEGQLLGLGYRNAHREAGVFCVTWEEAITHFDHCSISWSPFRYWKPPNGTEAPEDCTRLCCHGVYNMHDAGQHMVRQPQFHLCSHSVKAWTHLFLVFCPHTGDQSPLPPDSMLDQKAVDHLSGGEAIVRLRVYELTALPSLAQCKMRDNRGRRVSCSFGDCQGRRIVSETEGPRGLQPLAIAQGSRNEFITLQFDCLPGTREYVVVLDVLCDDRLSGGKDYFPYTLTLFTCLSPLLERNPNKFSMFAIHAQHAILEHAAREGCFANPDVVPADLNLSDIIEEEAQREPPGQTIAMHAIPEHPNIPTCTVQGLWSTLVLRERTVLLPHNTMCELLCTDTQYYFHLDAPEHFSLRICQSRRIGTVPPAVQMKVLLLRRTKRDVIITKEKDPSVKPKEHPHCGGRTATKDHEPYVPRSVEGDVTKNSDIVLSSGAWSLDGAVIDSVSPHTALLDRNGILVQHPQRLRQLHHTSFHVVLSNPDDDDKTNMGVLLISHPNPDDQMRSVILQAFADGFLISPHACNISIKGTPISHDTEVRAVLTSLFFHEVHNEEGHCVSFKQERANRSLTMPVPQLDQCIDVHLLSTASRKSTSFSPASNAGCAIDRLRAVVRTALKSSPGQRLRLLRTVFSTMAFVRHSVTDKRHCAFALGLGSSIEAWVRWHETQVSPGVQAPMLSLPPLPSGDYIIIPCFNPVSDDAAATPGRKRRAVRGNQSTLYFDVTLSVPGRAVELIPTKDPTDG
ncbi:hypothetical protein JKF63_01625 [Porcisia hertigi]|uniref:Calpain catalytic domain-containing protein n=1 Tax=Porcisia hertigi TaxID=2761500 RepID=A0A836LB01_9TRYP|nr:hypothetical protein JKF63_01625 [Porcisia hertigi]